MREFVQFTLSYSGELADDHQLELYDAAQALAGFQRSISLTAHLVLNGEVITQAPSLKGAVVLSHAPEPGSWKAIAIVGILYQVGTVERETVIGNLVTSAYDYVISESLGFHVDFDSTLGAQYDEFRGVSDIAPIVPQTKFDSLIEKCETSVKNIHRPIIHSNSARSAQIESTVNSISRQISKEFDQESYEFMTSEYDVGVCEISGKISSYNSNTKKGRVFVPSEGRTIPFELEGRASSDHCVVLVADSLAKNVTEALRSDDRSFLRFEATIIRSRSGQIKRYRIFDVRD